jgi:hypothetical protein
VAIDEVILVPAAAATVTPLGIAPRVTAIVLAPVGAVTALIVTAPVVAPVEVLHVSAIEVAEPVLKASKLAACIVPVPTTSPSIATKIILER